MCETITTTIPLAATLAPPQSTRAALLTWKVMHREDWTRGHLYPISIFPDGQPSHVSIRFRMAVTGRLETCGGYHSYLRFPSKNRFRASCSQLYGYFPVCPWGTVILSKDTRVVISTNLHVIDEVPWTCNFPHHPVTLQAINHSCAYPPTSALELLHHFKKKWDLHHAAPQAILRGIDERNAR